MPELLLQDYHPCSELRVPETRVEHPLIPGLDAHNHTALWEQAGRAPDDLLRLMDDLHIEKLVNIVGLLGEDIHTAFAAYEGRHPGRFVTIGAVDLAGLDAGDFPRRIRENLFRLKEAGFHGIKAWKNLGLRLRDSGDSLVAPDDERLAPVWHTAAELGWPVYLHLADPAAFFKPLNPSNERYEELVAHPDWHFYGGDLPGFEQILAAQERLLARESKTTFILAHMGAYAENLAYIGRLLDRYPHVNIDISARFAELGRQPYTARAFFLKYADRILYGLDATPDAAGYRLTFRFLETWDEYFPYGPEDPPSQGRWRIYGLGLPAPVLAKVYRDNALRLLPGLA